MIASLTTAETFPCSVSSLWRFTSHYHPSTPSLRRVYNGDYSLEVGVGSALESWALHTPGTIRARSPHSGNSRARPRPGNSLVALHHLAGLGTRRTKKTPHQNWESSLLHGHVDRGGTIIYGKELRTAQTLYPAQERPTWLLVCGEKDVLIGKSKRENVL